MEEIWKDVVGYEGRYEVSNLGRVRSLERIVQHSVYGQMPVSEKVLKAYDNNRGYLQVALYTDGKKKKHCVHNLVSETFLGHRRGIGFEMVIDHKDRNPLNNNLNNLRIVTPRENVSYKRGSSKYTGVSYNVRSKKYDTVIKVKGKTVHLGSHKDEKVCAQWYQDALKSLEKDPSGKSIVTYTKIPSSKYRGVCFHKASGKWSAYTDIGKKRKYLGLFICEKEAHKAIEKYLKDYN